MNAVLDIIVGRAIDLIIYREAVEKKLISHLLYNFILNPSMSASSDPFQRGSWGGRGGCSSMETMPVDGKTAYQGGQVCLMCVLLAKSLPRGIFYSSRDALRC